MLTSDGTPCGPDISALCSAFDSRPVDVFGGSTSADHDCTAAIVSLVVAGILAAAGYAIGGLVEDEDVVGP